MLMAQPADLIWKNLIDAWEHTERPSLESVMLDITVKYCGNQGVA